MKIRKVSCGLFGISDDYISDYQSLDERFVRNKASTYFFLVAGESMSPLILEKDILIVDRSLNQAHNRVVVVGLDGELFCKRWIQEKGAVRLVSDNPRYPEIQVSPEQDLQLFGVVIGLARDL
jgi:DNA polymerase V